MKTCKANRHRVYPEVADPVASSSSRTHTRTVSPACAMSHAWAQVPGGAYLGACGWVQTGVGAKWKKNSLYVSTPYTLQAVFILRAYNSRIVRAGKPACAFPLDRSAQPT